MYTRIDHIALNVSDLQQSVDFYKKHFGFVDYFDHTTKGGTQIKYLKLNGSDTVLELLQIPNDEIKGLHFCLLTRDFDHSVTTLQHAGVKMVQAPHDTPPRTAGEEGWRRVVFAGPDGEQIELRG